MTTIENTGPAITESDIVILESCVGLKWPVDYREFLLAYNGGYPVPNLIDITCKGLGYSHGASGYGLPGAIDVNVLFGIRRSIESSNLDWNISTFAERLNKLPFSLLPIGCDSGGNIFCLSLNGEYRGKVLYCDLQTVFADYKATPELYQVTSNFSSFLEQMN